MSVGDFILDDRGVSAVIGFILIFGILVLALSTYQAQIVPQENSATEFQHNQNTQTELIELRNSISTAGQSDLSQFSSISLGTTYQPRVLTINPPPATGTLQTSDTYPITIENKSESLSVETRFLKYQPGYNEMSIGPTWYEHSVLYLDERDRGNNVSIIEEQNLVKDGTVRITALQNEFQRTGIDSVTLELYPKDGQAGEFPSGEDLNVTIPTRLDGNEFWDDALEDESDIYENVDTNQYGEGIHALNLSVDEDDLEINTVGIQLEPDEDPVKNTDPHGGNGNDGNGEDEPKLNAEAESPVEEEDQSEITVSAEFDDGDPVPDEDIKIDVNDPGEDAFIRAVGEEAGENKVVNVGTNVNDDPLVVTTDENGNFGTAEDDDGEEFDVDIVEYDVSASSEEAGDAVELDLQANNQIEVTENPEIEVEEEVEGEPATIEVVGSEELGNNDDIDVVFDVDNDDGTTDQITVRLDDSPGGGEAGSDWETKEVTIEPEGEPEETFELTESAADDIGVNLNEIDLYEESSYETDEVSQSELDDYRNSITTESDETIVSDDGDVGLDISFVEL